MTREEAYDKLELEFGASQQEIKEQYQEFYNEFQLRIANAPTTHQKALYQKKLKELESAYEVLMGTITEAADADLPGMAPTDYRPPSPTTTPTKTKSLTKAEALKLLGIQEPFSKLVLDNAFRAKKREYENSKKRHTDKEFISALDKVIEKLQRAYELLIPMAQMSLGSERSGGKKTKSSVIWIVLVLMIVLAVLLILKPWSDSVDPEVEKQFTTLKIQADLLATEERWQEALAKYKEAHALMLVQEVQDSIVSLTQRLEAIEASEEQSTWESASKTNTVVSYQSYLEAYPEGKHKTEAKTAIAALEQAANDRAVKAQLAAQKAAAEKKKQAGNDHAVQVKFVTKTSKKKLGVNERLRIDFEMNHDGEGFNPPDFSNFTVVEGPNQSISNSWVNGVRTYKRSYRYILVPTKEGTFTISQASITIDGKTYKTTPVRIEVTRL